MYHQKPKKYTGQNYIHNHNKLFIKWFWQFSTTSPVSKNALVNFAKYEVGAQKYDIVIISLRQT